MNNVLLYIGGLFVAVFAALFAVPAMIDWNGYRGVFEEEASKVLGRDVRVGGAVNLSLLPSPYVRFEKVRLADLSGQTGEPFIRAESFTMRLAGPPLLRGVLEAKEIEFDRPTLTLALNGEGGGNWQDIQLASGALPFVPRDVTLKSVRIIDGTISLFRPNAELVGQVTKIDGELSADALEGPYRFKGDADWSGSEREIRFATTDLAADGSFRIKALVKSAGKGGANFNLDAKVEHVGTAPKLVGEVSGVFPVQFSQTDAEPPATGDAMPDTTALVDVPPVMEFKSSISATASEATFDDMTLSLQDTAVPQVMNGNASATWQNNPLMSLTLGAKWFDLDRLAGAGSKSAPFTRFKKLALGAMSAIAGEAAAVAHIDFDQVKLGGETAGGLKINVERRNKLVRLKELQASLPGGARVQLQGTVKDQTDGPVFDGVGHIHGTSLARLQRWAEKSGAMIDLKADGPFSAEGHVSISTKVFALSEASAEIAGQPVTGEIRIVDGAKQRVEITLESEKLTTEVMFPQTIAELEAEFLQAVGLAKPTRDGAVEAHGQTSGGDAAGGDAKSAQPAAALVADETASDIKLRVLAREIVHRERRYRNVDATVDLINGDIRIPDFHATLEKGSVVSVDGRVKRRKGRSKGTMAFDISAPDRQALIELAEVTGLSDRLTEARVAQWSDGKFAGSLRLGERTKHAADVSVNGTLGGVRVSLNAEFDDGLEHWRSAPSRIRVVADDAPLSSFLKGFGQPESSDEGVVGRPATVQIGVVGRLADAAQTTVSMQSDTMKIGFDGNFAIPENAPVTLAGRMRMDTGDVRDVLVVAGLPAPGGMRGIKAVGQIDLRRSAERTEFETEGLELGSVQLTATGHVSVEADGRRAIDAEVSTGTIALASLLAGVLAEPGEASAQTGDVGSGADSSDDADDLDTYVWPKSSLDFALTSKIGGTVRLKFAGMELSRGLKTGAGTTVLSLADGSVTLRDIDAAAASGRAMGQFTLAKAPGGAQFETNLSLTDMELGQLTGSGQGRATVQISASGRGDSLSNMMALANGNGRVTLDKATLPIPNVKAITPVLDAYLIDHAANRKSRRQDQDAELEAGLQQAIEAKPAALGSRSLDVSITAGKLVIEPATFESDAGTTAVTSTVGLGNLSVESEWQLRALPTPYAPPAAERPAGWSVPASKGELPAVTVRYRGVLGDLAHLEHDFDSSAMQSELVVRQMERNVTELERLRRLDEQRGRDDARRRAEEAQRRRDERNAEPALPPILPESYQSEGPATAPSTQPNDDNSAPLETQTAEPGSADVTDDPNGSDARPSPVKRAQRPPPPKRVRSRNRTAADEVMRSLGGFP